MSSSNLNSHDKKPVEEYLKRADTIMDKRFLYFVYSVLGKNSELQLQNGTKGKGKFHTASIDNGGVVIKNFTQPESENNNNVPTKVLDVKDFVYILVSDVEEPPLIKPKKSEFKTDTEISKNKLDDRRTFVKWGDEGNDLLGSTAGMTLEESAHEKGKWNQFEMNEKRFGLRSNYEENMYTTHLDMKNVSASLLEKATRLEAEILNNAADLDNRHIREERGLQELKEDEDEEFLYSSVYRTDPKKGGKADSKADEERKPKFTNSKKNTTTTPATTTTTTTTPAAQSTTQKSESLAPPQASTENKKESKPLEVSSNRRDFVPSGVAAFNGSSDPKATKPAANERTPKASDLPDTQTLNRQSSNMSEDALRKKGSLSVSSGAFGNFDAEPKKEPLQVQIPEKKDENKAAPSKQGSLELDAEKKANLLTPADFHTALTTKFKLKITDKEIKRSSMSFFEYATPNWQKKPIVTDPSAVNPNWKAAKAQALNQVASKVMTPTSQPTTTTSTPKLSQKPNTNAPPFNAGSTMPANNFGGGMMMGQMGQPFIPGGYAQPQFMNPGMQFMPPMQKFTPGFPMPQPTMPMYGMPGYVDPNQPTFNMGMNYQPHHGGGARQGGPGNRNFNKNKPQ